MSKHPEWLYASSAYVKPGEIEAHEAARVENGFSPLDAYNFDRFLAIVISRYIDYELENAKGYPGSLSSMEEWEEILKTIKTKLELYLSDDSEDALIAGKEAMHTVADYFENLWD